VRNTPTVTPVVEAEHCRIAQATAPLFLYPKQSFAHMRKCPIWFQRVPRYSSASGFAVRRREEARTLAGTGTEEPPAKVNTADLLGVGRVTLMVKT
jgi:hypothetical protein